MLFDAYFWAWYFGVTAGWVFVWAVCRRTEEQRRAAVGIAAALLLVAVFFRFAAHTRLVWVP